MDKELIAVVTIPKYIRKVQVSDNRKPTYYRKGEKLPVKYSSKLALDYQWVKFKNYKLPLLCDAHDKPVIKNINSVGTPKFKIINGQDLHTLTMQDYERSKIITAIKAQMIPEVAKIDIINVPIIIEAELYDTIDDNEILSTKGKIKDTRWDMDNRFAWYQKVFPDVLCGCPYRDLDSGEITYLSSIKIKDDDRKHIRNAAGCLFFPISNTEDRKLVFKIYKDLRVL